VREVEPQVSGDRRQAIMTVIREVVTQTKVVRFDGNGYSQEWRNEAARRGLPSARNTVEALMAWEDAGVQELFVRAGVMSTLEQESRIHVRHEQYVKTLQIEAQVLREMAETQILPVLLEDLQNKAKSVSRLESLGIARPEQIRRTIESESTQIDEAYKRLGSLRGALAQADSVEELHARTTAFAQLVLPACQSLRESLDALEDQCDTRLWPLPKYRELLAPL
jgi:glutamine synthetase